MITALSKKVMAVRPTARKKRAAALRRSENTAECLDLSGHSCGCEDPPTAGPPPKSCLSVKSQRESLGSSFGSGLNLSHSTRSVRFDRVEFREYAIVLDDSPATTSGPSIGLSWAYEAEDTRVSDLDRYEELREAPRTRAELAIPAEVREGMLLEAGYSRSEIRAAVAQARRARRSPAGPQAALGPICKLAERAASSFKSRTPNQRFREHRDSLSLSHQRQHFQDLRSDSLAGIRRDSLTGIRRDSLDLLPSSEGNKPSVQC